MSDPRRSAVTPPHVENTRQDEAVLAVLAQQPLTAEVVASKAGTTTACALAALHRLRAGGRARGDSGWWRLP